MVAAVLSRDQRPWNQKVVVRRPALGADPSARNRRTPACRRDPPPKLSEILIEKGCDLVGLSRQPPGLLSFSAFSLISDDLLSYFFDSRSDEGVHGPDGLVLRVQTHGTAHVEWERQGQICFERRYVDLAKKILSTFLAFCPCKRGLVPVSTRIHRYSTRLLIQRRPRYSDTELGIAENGD